MRPARIILLALVTGVLGCDALPGCGADEPVAELREAKGEVQRDHAAERGKWQAAEVGARFAEGDGVRTGSGASAVVRVRGEGLLRLDADTVVRFSAGGPHREGATDTESAPGIEVESGQAALETGGRALPIRTRFGTAVLEPGTRVQLSPGEHAQGGVRFVIEMGGAAFQHDNGQTAQLGAGEAIEVGIGMAVLEDAEGSPVEREAAAKPGEETAGEASGEEAAEPGASAGEPIDAIVHGGVRRRGEGEADWSPLSEGALQLADGVELDLDQGSRVEVTRGDERATLHGKGRYRLGGAGGHLVDALDGRLSVSADRRDVRVRVPGGTIVARAVDGGTRADLKVAAGTGTTTVHTERGELQTEGFAEEHALRAGQEASLHAGDEDLGGDESEDGAAATADEGDRTGRGLDYAEVTVPVGETFRIYDPAPPVAVGFTFDGCEEGGELRLRDGRRVRGRRQINLAFKRGLHRYALHCVVKGEARPKALATGKLRVLRGSGTARLPTTAPDNHVDTDGRNYTVMYQNLKPRVHVRWPKAPKSARYTLHLKAARGADRKLAGKKPVQVLPGRLLGDGKNVVYFATDKGARSPTTTLELVFDNAAPTASIRAPPVEGFGAGATARVAGVAVTGSKVSVGGTRVPLDRQSRFEADVPVSAGQRALAIRFQHPRHGVRYYVRRRAGATR